MAERRRLVVTDGDRQRDVVVVIPTERPWRIRVEGDAVAVEAEGADLFAALCATRRELESFGLLLCCQGARRDVYPSGMSRQMGGRRAYRLWPGRPSTFDDLVDIFDPAEPEDVVTVDEQHANVARIYDAG